MQLQDTGVIFHMIFGFVFFFLPDVLRFDNSYSWARSKKVFYIIEVLEPDTDMDLSKDLSFSNLNDNDADYDSESSHWS